jgi:hypothetical protein
MNQERQKCFLGKVSNAHPIVQIWDGRIEVWDGRTAAASRAGSSCALALDDAPKKHTGSATLTERAFVADRRKRKLNSTTAENIQTRQSHRSQ